jgi:hypothetical protein
VAQDGLGPVRVNGSNEDTAPIESAVANGIDALVHTVQAAPCEPGFDGTGVEPQAQELPKGHNSVLPLGQFGDLTITWM